MIRAGQQYLDSIRDGCEVPPDAEAAGAQGRALSPAAAEFAAQCATFYQS